MATSGCALHIPTAAPAPQSRDAESSRSRCGGGGSRVADGVTVDDEFDAAVTLAAFGGVVRSHGLRLAEAVGGDGRRRYALFGEKITDGIGAAFGELLV